jgi:hypothetical protein
LADSDLADCGQKRASTNSVEEEEKTAITLLWKLMSLEPYSCPRPFPFVLILAIYFVIETTM